MVGWFYVLITLDVIESDIASLITSIIPTPTTKLYICSFVVSVGCYSSSSSPSPKRCEM